MRCPHPEPVALLPSEGRRQRRTQRRRRVPPGDPHTLRLRYLDLAHHADSPGRHGGQNRAFDAVATCAAVERRQATVLCCVSTQLAMILANPASREYDLTSLRVVFTGGEPLPYTQAAQFEDLTGVTILQFYGSNETGMLSATTVEDTLHRTAAHGRPDRAGDAGAALRRRSRRHGIWARTTRVPRPCAQSRVPGWHRPRQAVHKGRLDADGRHLRTRRRRVPHA